MKDRKTIWEAAMVPGLVLGAIPAVCAVLAGLLDSWQPEAAFPVMLKTLAAMLLWAAKISCCIAAFRIFMMKFRESGAPEGNELFRFGAAIALLSAVIYSGFNMAYMTYFCPDNVNQAIQMLQEQAVAKMDANARASFEEMLPDLPRIMFFANLVYCFCFGTILSAIFSSKINK